MMVRWDVFRQGHSSGDRRKVLCCGSPNITPVPRNLLPPTPVPPPAGFWGSGQLDWKKTRTGLDF